MNALLVPDWRLSRTVTPSVSPAMRSCSPSAARCATTVDSTIPPAHNPSTCVESVPLMASTASSASSTAWA
jgi:hypothetical protein